MKRVTFKMAASAVLVFLTGSMAAAAGVSDGVVKIGVLTDMSGAVSYTHLTLPTIYSV